MKIFKFVFVVITFCFLTVLTQIGGIAYLISFLTYKFINDFSSKKTSQVFLKGVSFLLIYLFATFAIVPLLAKPFGRVPLPLTEKNNLQPLNILTCFLNRNYVRAELREATFDVAKKMNVKFPGTKVNYLDASFSLHQKLLLLIQL